MPGLKAQCNVMQHFAYIPALRNRSILRYFRNNHQLAANGARISVQRQVVFYQHVTSLVAYLCNKKRRSHRTIWHISPPDTAFFTLFVDVFESEKPPFAVRKVPFRVPICRVSHCGMPPFATCAMVWKVF